MSTPGKDNLSSEQRRKVNRENQKASAIGNKSVESATAKTEAPQLDSVNAPKAPLQQVNVGTPQTNTPAQLLTNEQIAQQRMSQNAEKIEEYKKNQKAVEQQTTQQAIQQGLALPATERTVETSTLGPMKQMAYRTDEYDAEGAQKRMEQSSWLKNMIDQANALNKQYEDKAKDASRMAKANALGNLVVALGQLAGGGQATYVKPTTSRYLTESMSKVDKARELYDAIRASNEKSINEAKSKWSANDQALFLKDREAYNKMVKDYNDMQVKIAEKTGTKTKTKYSNDDLYKQEELKIKRKRLAATEKGLELKEIAQNQKNDKQKKDAEDRSFINYKDNDIMQNYNLNESEARRIANYMIKNKGYTEDKLGLVGDAITGVISEGNMGKFKGQVLDFLDNADWENEPEVVAIMNNSDNYPFGTDEERYGDKQSGWAGAPKAD